MGGRVMISATIIDKTFLRMKLFAVEPHKQRELSWVSSTAKHLLWQLESEKRMQSPVLYKL